MADSPQQVMTTPTQVLSIAGTPRVVHCAKIRMNHIDAAMYAFGLGRHWRMLTLTEAEQIFKSESETARLSKFISEEYPAARTEASTGLVDGLYWTSSLAPNSIASFWYLSLKNKTTGYCKDDCGLICIFIFDETYTQGETL